jgi:hypothetical protein
MISLENAVYVSSLKQDSKTFQLTNNALREMDVKKDEFLGNSLPLIFLIF